MILCCRSEYDPFCVKFWEGWAIGVSLSMKIKKNYQHLIKYVWLMGQMYLSIQA